MTIQRDTIAENILHRLIQRDTIAENILNHLSDLENYPDEALAPYEEFTLGGKTYYFTPGGFL